MSGLDGEVEPFLRELSSARKRRRLEGCGGGAAVLRALNKRCSRSSRLNPLRLRAAETTPTTLSDILSARPEEDRSRDVKRSHRMLYGA